MFAVMELPPSAGLGGAWAWWPCGCSATPHAPRQHHRGHRDGAALGARRGRAGAVASAARAIAIGLARTTVILVEERGLERSRHLGLVRMLSADGRVLARRRLVSSEQAHADAMVGHLIDEVRIAMVAAPHLVVGVVQDAGTGSWDALRAGLARLADEHVIAGWHEAVDDGALRARLERTLCVIEADAMAREDALDHWDACLDAWDHAIDGVDAFLRAHRDGAAQPTVIDVQLAYLAEHRARMRHAALHGHAEHTPRRLARGTAA